MINSFINQLIDCYSNRVYFSLTYLKRNQYDFSN